MEHQLTYLLVIFEAVLVLVRFLAANHGATKGLGLLVREKIAARVW